MQHAMLAQAATRTDVATELVQDLAVLCDGPVIDLQISFDGGLIAMRSNDKLVFQEAAEARWRRLDGAARARLLVAWIHQAATKYRELLKSRLGDRSQAEVA